MGHYDNPEELTFQTDASTDTNLDTTDTTTDTTNTHSDTTDTSTDTCFDTTLTPKQQKVLEYCKQPHTSKEILEHIEVSYHSKNIKKYITDMVASGHLGLTITANPRDPHQKYYTKQH